MTPLRVLIVDDESLALARLRMLVQSITEVELVGEAGSCHRAMVLINELKPNVVLLDIKMRDGNGFDLVQALADRPNAPAIILVTAYDQYAPQAFDSQVVDYLLKPVEQPRLFRALVRAEQRLRAGDAEQRASELQLVLKNVRAASKVHDAPAHEYEFWLNSATGVTRVPVDSIDYVRSADEYISIHSQTGSYLLRASIRQFAARLEPGLFVRVHRCWLVKRSSIVEVRTKKPGKSEVVLRNGLSIPVGRVHRNNLKSYIKHQQGLRKGGWARARLDATHQSMPLPA